jgi:hypothetical protein
MKHILAPIITVLALVAGALVWWIVEDLHE